MPLRLLLLLSVLFLLPLSPARAEVVQGLYAATIPVPDQERDTRTRALTDGLREVFMRVSGRDLLTLMEPGVETALALPTRYVQRYRYETREIDGKRQLVLQVDFDPEAVNKVLRESRLPVWGRNRPDVLAWVVVRDRRGRKLLTGDSPAQLREPIMAEAARRGLPLRLPLYDLTDRARLTVADIWGNFEDRILDASQRYQSRAVLVGRIERVSRHRWRSRWTLYNEGRRDDWEGEGTSLASVFGQGIAGSTMLLAERYAQAAEVSQPGVVRVRVLGIPGLPEYTRVIRYLAGLDGVTRAAPEEVRPDSVLFSLVTRNGQLAVARAIELGHTLIPEVPAVTGSEATSPAAGVPNPDQPATEQSQDAAVPVTIAPLPADLVYRLVP